MRNIKYIVLHCTAGPQDQSIEAIQNYWRKNLGWKSPGYHHIIKADGSVADLLPIGYASNGVAGYNSVSINISYTGGVEKNGKPVDNRTPEQKARMEKLVRHYHERFPNAKIQGHRDFPNVKKDCPSFSVAEWLKEIGL